MGDTLTPNEQHPAETRPRLTAHLITPERRNKEIKPRDEKDASSGPRQGAVQILADQREKRIHRDFFCFCFICAPWCSRYIVGRGGQNDLAE
jgi:hypothetical protein